MCARDRQALKLDFFILLYGRTQYQVFAFHLAKDVCPCTAQNSQYIMVLQLCVICLL